WLFNWPFDVATGRPYPGRAGLRLRRRARRLDLVSCIWGTARQWEELGCAVRPPPGGLPSAEWGLFIPGICGTGEGAPGPPFNAGQVVGPAAALAGVSPRTVRPSPAAER